MLAFLTKYDRPLGLAMQLFRRYGADAMDALRRNPYLLSGEAFGVDFSVSDEIALSMGFSGDSSCRTEAGVLFELSHNEQSGGHVFLPREKLVAATAQLLLTLRPTSTSFWLTLAPLRSVLSRLSARSPAWA